jgi:hypothetical protein
MVINRGQANTCTFTLYEMTTISNPVYLFEAENKQTKQKSYCILTPELSTQLVRFNQFVITETDTPDPLASEISLTEGDYKYTVYQQASTTNLSPTGLTAVEEMELQVKDSTANTNTAYDGASTTNTAYEG